MIPEDMYTSLISNNIDHSNFPVGSFERPNLEDDLLLKYTKNKLNKIRDARRMDQTSKHMLYDQELRRYLKMRREMKDRPVKIELPTGMKGIMTTDPNEHPVNSEKGKHVSLLDTEGEFQPTEMSTLRNSDQYDTEDEDFDTAIETPIGRERPQRIKPNKQRKINEAIHEFYSHVMENPKKFSVTSSGKVVHPKTGIPMTNTDLMGSIERLVYPTPYNAPSPIGTDTLRSRALRDPFLTKLMNKRFLPGSTSTPKQGGSGRRIIQKKFRPEKWTN